MRNGRFNARTLITVAASCLILGVLITASLNLVPLTKATTAQFWTEKRESGLFSSSQISDGKLWVKLAKELTPAVVNISTTQVIKGRGVPSRSPFGEDDPFNEFFKRFFGDQPRQFKATSLGSGFIINKDGYILTNNHVVENATDITVKLGDSQEFKAKLIGRDPKTDIALIKIEASNLPVIPLGDSDKLEVGEPVMAIGNPFGLNQTVTTGIVSAKGRFIGEGPYDNFIQTDASINRGNSGGPLINTNGEAVGINTAIFSPTGGSIGIGFAIPIDMTKEVLPQLKERGQVTRGWLGVAIQPITPDLGKKFSLKQANGALVSDVMEGSPAEHAGVKQGDVIVEFDGKKVKTSTDLPHIVASTPVGKEVPMKVIRDGAELTLQIKVGQLKEEQVAAMASSSPKTKLGIDIQELNPTLSRKFGLKGEKGVVITEVEPDSPGDAVGLQPGDLILEINRVRVTTVSQVRRVLEKTKPNEPTLLLVKRDGGTRYVVIGSEG
ncbi:MAG: DegQ family serine endoprotease [candidate division NC10 bacterium]|nr:DegQ family serine endoprotease [candidate division NC10 bacterium]MDE2322302.1 DegQ family serine endoprotease [candidate division NC10 bacterium]